MFEDPRHREMCERETGVGGELEQLLDEVELALVLGQLVVEAVGHAGGPPAARQVAPTPVLSGEPPAGQRAPRDDAHAVALTRRQHGRLDAAGEDRVRRLLAAEPFPPSPLGRPLRLDDEFRRIGRASQDPDLALVDEVAQGAQGVVDIDGRVRSVGLVEVDVVGAEPAQAVLDLLHDPTS